MFWKRRDDEWQQRTEAMIVRLIAETQINALALQLVVSRLVSNKVMTAEEFQRDMVAMHEDAIRRGMDPAAVAVTRSWAKAAGLFSLPDDDAR